jgi:tRNA threonylcarbamoyl adenosine modification protein YeaZ
MTVPSGRADAAAEGWLLALHSCSDVLGLGLQHPRSDTPDRLDVFPLGRALSNDLLSCLETLLPADRWRSIGRLAVAIGPGGFTGTRLTVVLARTLAQQLHLPLDGVSSFRLMAQRQARHHRSTLGGDVNGSAAPFWLVQELPRRGLVAGLYGHDSSQPGGVSEMISPRLFRTPDDLDAAVGGGALSQGPPRRYPARVVLPEDVQELLTYSRTVAGLGTPAPWQVVLPLYPTSPVDRS